MMADFRSGIIEVNVTTTMRAADQIDGLISAMRDSAPPYEQTHITNTQLLNDMLREIDRHIEQAIRDVRDQHSEAITHAINNVGKGTAGIKRYERTMYMLMRAATGASDDADKQKAPAVHGKSSTPAPTISVDQLFPSAYSAANALGLLMALYRMRCTYRIGLSRFLVYDDDGITQPFRA